MCPGLSRSPTRASHIHLLMSTTHSSRQEEPAGVQGWPGLGLGSRVLLSLGKFIAAFSHASPLRKGAGASAFRGEHSPAGTRESRPPSPQPLLPSPLRDCGFSAAGAWKQPRKGRQRGQGHPCPHLHPSESSQRGTPTRIKAGTNMPLVIRSPLLDRAVMLKLASNHPGKEHQSLRHRAAGSPDRRWQGCLRGGRSRENSRASWSGQRLNWSMKVCRVAWLPPLLHKSPRATRQGREGRKGSQPTAGCAKPTRMLP